MNGTGRGIRRLKALAVLLAFFAVLLLPAVPARADTATDYLTVKVGYSGMALSDYVQAGKYYWSELEGLGAFEETYSYYQAKSGTDYVAIVDSAWGVAVEDVLNYAGIYRGDIYNLQFYVEDHHGIQAAFDASSLFCTRYYFDDLPFHLERIYDEETGELTGYGYDEVWNYARSVRPMLALEDNWVAFTQEFEHIGPNFESMNPSNRFRLLFGQTGPTESLTSASAKYVSCIYVTLWGQPTFGEMPELEASLGSHTVTARVRVDNLDLRNALSEFMELVSTDETVLRITGIRVVAVEGYSDLADVIIDYEIVGEGSASITASFGGTTAPVGIGAPVLVAAEEPEEPEDPGGTETPPETEPGQETDPAGGEPAGQEGGTAAEEPDGGAEEPGTQGREPPVPEDPDTGEPETAEQPEERESEEQTPEEQTPAEEPKADAGTKKPAPSEKEKKKPEERKTEPEEPAQTDGDQAVLPEVSEPDAEAAPETADEILPPDVTGRRLSGRVGQKLDGRQTAAADPAVGGPDAASANAVPAAADVQQLLIDDTEEEDRERERQLLLWTGLSCAGICALGAGGEVALFHWRLKRGSPFGK
ncbi:MAG: hypothetical protein IK082_06435 [Oscillospiraceae bacterium]|nr:hypothetical protein [Oscillospiraceae bacterium]